MTYQLTLRGHNGILLASDRREGSFPASSAQGEGSFHNMIPKIRLDPTRRFAWMFAGADVSVLAANYLERVFERGIPDGALERSLRDCCDLAWANGPSGLSGGSTIVLADGEKRNILRAKIMPVSEVLLIEEGRCFSGQSYSKASFFPHHFYASDMSVEQLAAMAAYTVQMAGEMDSLLIGGIDLAMYRKSVGHFEFADYGLLKECSTKIDEEIRTCFRTAILPL
ncbi:MAG: hypothetical protein WA817_16515 [Candidatus Acidiferrum sp.]